MTQIKYIAFLTVLCFHLIYFLRVAGSEICGYFFMVLCLWVTYFRRGARPEICGYFKLQIWVTNWVKSERYMGTEARACVSTVPDDVPYPIEPTRYVLGRDTTAFQIGTHEPGV